MSKAETLYVIFTVLCLWLSGMHWWNLMHSPRPAAQLARQLIVSAPPNWRTLWLGIIANVLVSFVLGYFGWTVAAWVNFVGLLMLVGYALVFYPKLLEQEFARQFAGEPIQQYSPADAQPEHESFAQRLSHAAIPAPITAVE